MKSASTSPDDEPVSVPRRSRARAVLVACALSLSVFASLASLGCDEKTTNKPVTIDSNTNWLKRCDDDKQCDGASQCFCGLCTKTCKSDAQCAALGEGASCESTTRGVAKDRCATHDRGSASAVCVIECAAEGSCDDAALACVEGLCERAGLPDEDAATSGSDAAMASSDAATGLDAAGSGDASQALDATASDDAALDASADAAMTPACTPGPCANGGRCSNDGLTCLCPVGISGATCGTIASVRQLVSGGNHACALLGSGVVKCWGDNEAGQLGQGDVLARGDAANELGANLPAIQLGTSTLVHSITAGTAHTCVLFVDGMVKCWGQNTDGELGIGTVDARGDGANEMGTMLPFVPLGSTPVAQLSAGDAHTCALFRDGRVACWGANSQGQLGVDDPDARGDGAGELGVNLDYALLGTTLAKQVIASVGYSCALFEDDTLKCWGRNQLGQLGVGDTNPRGAVAGDMAMLTAIPLGDVSSGIVSVDSRGQHVCILLGSGAVRCWGFGGVGQLALGSTASIGDNMNEMGANLADAKLGASAAQLAAGGVHACAVLSGNVLKCWGQNNAGQLGVGDLLARGDDATEIDAMLPSVMLPAGTITQVAAGEFHTCVLLDATSIYCFGTNQLGQLGRGDMTDVGDDGTEVPIPGPAVAL